MISKKDLQVALREERASRIALAVECASLQEQIDLILAHFKLKVWEENPPAVPPPKKTLITEEEYAAKKQAENTRPIICQRGMVNLPYGYFHPYGYYDPLGNWCPPCSDNAIIW